MVPRRVLVIGAGMVGLSCAWSLQNHGVEVEVLDKARAGSGASWGNAGYLAPAFTVPLPEPSVLRDGARAMVDRNSPVRLPLRPDVQLARFLFRFVRHCTGTQWSQAMEGYRRVNAQIFDAFDAQRAAGVQAPTHDGSVLAAFANESDSAHLLHGLEAVAAAGQPVDFETLTGDQARAAEPNLSERIALAVSVLGQRYLDPARYVTALAEHVRARGAKITEHTTATAVERHAGRTVVRCADGTRRDADAVIIANGAWMSELARPHGVRMPQYAGRGYSFSVPLKQPLRGPLYFAAARAAVAPRGDRAHITCVMELRHPEHPLDPSRIASTVRAVRPLLDGARWEDTADHWVGARPLTADGIPLAGPTRTEGVYVAGGHGMWGVTLGPLTGRLLADHLITGATSPELAWMNPVR